MNFPQVAIATAGTPHRAPAEISVRGKWVRVPALRVGESTIVVTGKLLRIASVDEEDWLETEVQNPALCLQLLTEQRKGPLQADIFTFSQKLPAVAPKYFYPLEWDSVAAVRLAGFKDWWEGLPQETRKNVRRSQKRGVEIGIRLFSDDLVRAIVSVNNERPVRQGRRFPHYGKTFDEVKKDYSSFLDRSDLICAYFGTELIGFLKLVYRGDIASVLQLLVKLDHQDKRPANALLAKAVELSTAKGLSHLTYGKFQYGKKRDDTLTVFKMRHGFQEMLVPRYYVPLTNWGTLCARLRLYRGALGILPNAFITAGLKMRLAWYQMVGLTGRCSSVVERPKRTRQAECSIPPAGSKT